MDPLRETGRGVRKGGKFGKEEFLQEGAKNIVFITCAVENTFTNKRYVPKHWIFPGTIYSHISFLTCPEGGSLPVMVVMGETGKARHTARVVVLEPFEEFTQFFSAFLFLLQPLILLLSWHSNMNKKKDCITCNRNS